jgi:hypothetical protein
MLSASGTERVTRHVLGEGRADAQKAHFQVEVMDVATMRSLVSGSSVYLSCLNPS